MYQEKNSAPKSADSTKAYVCTLPLYHSLVLPAEGPKANLAQANLDCFDFVFVLLNQNSRVARRCPNVHTAVGWPPTS